VAVVSWPAGDSADSPNTDRASKRLELDADEQVPAGPLSDRAHGKVVPFGAQLVVTVQGSMTGADERAWLRRTAIGCLFGHPVLIAHA
jgi:hypothetical protein